MSHRLRLPCLLVALASCTASPGTRQTPVPLHNAKPTYPPVAQLHGRSATVVLDCTITGKGDARDCAATEGDHDFVAAALAYMGSARYLPAMRDGIPVAYTHYTLGIHFQAVAPRPAVIPVHCSVAASGVIRDCRPDSAAPPSTWPVARTMAAGARIAPGGAAGQAVVDSDRALILVFAYVHLPWFGPEPRIKGDTSLTGLLNCERHSVAPGTVSLSCRMAGSGNDPASTGATEHLRAYLGISNTAPPATGDLDDPS